MPILTRRDFGRFAAASFPLGLMNAFVDGGASGAMPPPGRSQEEDGLRSEFLLDIVIEVQRARALGNGRVVVPVSGGTFSGPRLKGRIVAPSGDWIVERSDGSRVLDVRLLVQTDDEHGIYVSWHGIAASSSTGGLVARILPVFETGAEKYAWLNEVVGVGVYHPTPHKIAYRVYRIL